MVVILPSTNHAVVQHLDQLCLVCISVCLVLYHAKNAVFVHELRRFLHFSHQA